MGEPIQLTSARTASRFGAYRAPHEDARRGGLVLIQEIFGVTDHIRELADGFAADGYETIAPSLYDRQQPGFQAGYDGEDVAAARRYSEAAPWDEVAGDLAACVAALEPPVFVAGYCWGGAATWLAACRCEGVAAASSFYGRRIPELMAETPRCPIILHFGRRDPTIPPATVERDRRRAIPTSRSTSTTPATASSPTAAPTTPPTPPQLARLRTLQLFTLHGGGRGENLRPLVLTTVGATPHPSGAARHLLPQAEKDALRPPSRSGAAAPGRARCGGPAGPGRAGCRCRRRRRRRRFPGSRGRWRGVGGVEEDEGGRAGEDQHHRQHRDDALAEAGAEGDPQVHAQHPAHRRRQQRDHQRRQEVERPATAPCAAA